MLPNRFSPGQMLVIVAQGPQGWRRVANAVMLSGESDPTLEGVSNRNHEGIGMSAPTHEAVATRIRAYLSRNFLFSEEGFAYDDDASFLELGVIDSFGFNELLHWVEEEFSISVGDDELIPDNFDSIARVTAFILRKQEEIV